ncbi:winged helix-turn-helix transcriptional regulator [Gymnodinialimonas sp. 2305UL16-5]
MSSKVHLSPPAVQGRIKRLRRDGLIRGRLARLDGDRIGCSHLVVIHVMTEGWRMMEPI